MGSEANSGSNYRLPTSVTGDTMYPSSLEYLMQNRNISVSSNFDSGFGSLSKTVSPSSFTPQSTSGDTDTEVIVNNTYRAFNIPPRYGIDTYGNNYNVESDPNLPVLPSSPVTSSGVDCLLLRNRLLEVNQDRAQQIKRKQNELGFLGSMAQPRMQSNQNVYPSPMNIDDSAHVQKRPRSDSNKDDVFTYMIQQLLTHESHNQSHSNDSKPVPLVSENQSINALPKETVQLPVQSTIGYHQQSVNQLKQLPEPQGLPVPATSGGPVQSTEGHCHQPVTQLKHLPEPQVFPVAATSGSACADRLVQYLLKQRQRPKQNNIAYWRKFVLEFFDINAKKRWCLSKYDHEGCHAQFPSPLNTANICASKDPWKCDICGTKSGRGFEAKFDLLPRLWKAYFDDGVVEELLHLDAPFESILPSGFLMVQFTKAVQETIYRHSRVVQEGKLRVTYTKDLKIIAWEFCAQRHEEYILRRSVAPQVQQLMQVSQKCKENIDKSKSYGNMRNSMQAMHNRFVRVGQQLEKISESHVNDSGLPNQLERLLSVAEVMYSMKDLMTFSHQTGVGPIESLNRYGLHGNYNANLMNEQSVQQGSRAIFSTQNNPMPVRSKAEQAWNPYLNSANHGSIALREPTAQPSSSTRMIRPTNNAGYQDPRKYVLKKQLILNSLDAGPSQDHQMQRPSPMVNADGRFTAMTNAQAQAQAQAQGTPRRGSMLSGYMNQDLDEMEDEGVPMLPGVQVRKDIFYSQGH